MTSFGPMPFSVSENEYRRDQAARWIHDGAGPRRPGRPTMARRVRALTAKLHRG